MHNLFMENTWKSYYNCWQFSCKTEKKQN